VAEVGLAARTRKNGALLERWRAQCGLSRSTIHDPPLHRIPASASWVRRILHTAFL